MCCRLQFKQTFLKRNPAIVSFPGRPGAQRSVKDGAAPSPKLSADAAKATNLGSGLAGPSCSASLASPSLRKAAKRSQVIGRLTPFP